jgi:hypothetical protein
MYLKLEYTFPGGLPKIKEQIASLATFMFWKLAKIN